VIESSPLAIMDVDLSVIRLQDVTGRLVSDVLI
jgi:hypothetical protein